MIKGLFETHIEVADLERSMKFYEEILGLQFGIKEEKRRIAVLPDKPRPEVGIVPWDEWNKLTTPTSMGKSSGQN